MDKQIIVQIRSIYGNETIYPACQQSHIFARIAGTKTLTTETMKLIRSLGYEIAVEQPRVLFAA